MVPCSFLFVTDHSIICFLYFTARNTILIFAKSRDLTLAMQGMSFQNTFPCFHTFCGSDQSLCIATPFYILNFCFLNVNSIIIRPHIQVQSYLCMYACICTYVYIPYSGKVWQENIWRIYFFWVFGKKSLANQQISQKVGTNLNGFSFTNHS